MQKSLLVVDFTSVVSHTNSRSHSSSEDNDAFRYWLVVAPDWLHSYLYSGTKHGYFGSTLSVSRAVIAIVPSVWPTVKGVFLGHVFIHTNSAHHVQVYIKTEEMGMTGSNNKTRKWMYKYKYKCKFPNKASSSVYQHIISRQPPNIPPLRLRFPPLVLVPPTQDSTAPLHLVKFMLQYVTCKTTPTIILQ